MKIVLGIALPILIIITLILLSVSNVGWSVSEETVEAVEADELFFNESKPYAGSKHITIHTINIKNDFFLPRGYVLPYTLACYGTIQLYTYSFGDYQKSSYPYPGPIEPVPVRTTPLSSVSMPAYGEKEVTVYLAPFYRYGEIVKESEILFFKFDKEPENFYNYCQNPDMDKAIRIPIIE